MCIALCQFTPEQLGAFAGLAAVVTGLVTSGLAIYAVVVSVRTLRATSATASATQDQASAAARAIEQSRQAAARDRALDAAQRRLQHLVELLDLYEGRSIDVRGGLGGLGGAERARAIARVFALGLDKAMPDEVLEALAPMGDEAAATSRSGEARLVAEVRRRLRQAAEQVERLSAPD